MKKLNKEFVVIKKNKTIFYKYEEKANCFHRLTIDMYSISIFGIIDVESKAEEILNIFKKGQSVEEGTWKKKKEEIEEFGKNIIGEYSFSKI